MSSLRFSEPCIRYYVDARALDMPTGVCVEVAAMYNIFPCNILATTRKGVSVPEVRSCSYTCQDGLCASVITSIFDMVTDIER